MRLARLLAAALLLVAVAAGCTAEATVPPLPDPRSAVSSACR